MRKLNVLSTLPWIALVIIAVIAGLYVQHGYKAARHMTSVAVAIHAVPPYTRITKADVGMVNRVLVNDPQTPLTTKQVIGKFTSVGLVPGEMITPPTLSSLGSLAKVPSGYQIIPIPLAQDDFPIQNLAVGEYVNIEGISQGQQATSKTIASHVEILETIASTNGAPPKILVAIPNANANEVTAYADSGNSRVNLNPPNGN